MDFYIIVTDNTFIKYLILIALLGWLSYNFYLIFGKNKILTELFRKINLFLIALLIIVVGIYNMQILLRYYDGVIIKEYYPNNDKNAKERLVVYTFGEKMKSGPTYVIYEKKLLGNFKCNIKINATFEYHYDFDLVEEYKKILNLNDSSFCHRKVAYDEGYFFE